MYKIYEEYFCSQDIDQRLVAVVVTIRYSEILNCVVHCAHTCTFVHVQCMILYHLRTYMYIDDAFYSFCCRNCFLIWRSLTSASTISRR